MIVLPTMHKRIRRTFLRLVFLFGALGALLLAGISIAGRVPSELIRMNYDSIAYAQEMVRAMNGIRFPELYREYDRSGWDRRFGQILEQARARNGRPSTRCVRRGRPSANSRTTATTARCTRASTRWCRSTSAGCSCA